MDLDINKTILEMRNNSNIYNNLKQCLSKEQYDENYNTLRQKYLTDRSLTTLERDYYLRTLQYNWLQGNTLGIPSFRQYGQHYFDANGNCSGFLLSDFEVEPDGETMPISGVYRCQSAIECGMDKCK